MEVQKSDGSSNVDMGEKTDISASDISNHLDEENDLVNAKEEETNFVDDFQSNDRGIDVATCSTEAGENTLPVTDVCDTETDEVKYVQFIIQDESNSSENDEVKYMHILTQEEMNSTDLSPMITENGGHQVSGEKDVIKYVSEDDLSISKNNIVTGKVETDPQCMHNIEPLTCTGEDTKFVITEPAESNEAAEQPLVKEGLDSTPLPIVTDVKMGVSGTQIIQIDNISYEIAPVVRDDDDGQHYEIIRMISESELETEFCTSQPEVHVKSEIMDGNVERTDTMEVLESLEAGGPLFITKVEPDEEWKLGDDLIPIDFKTSEFCGKLNIEEECSNNDTDPCSSRGIFGDDLIDEVESLDMSEVDLAQDVPRDEQGQDEQAEKQLSEVFEVLALDDLENVLYEYCQRTSSHFVGLSRSKNFGVPITPGVLVGHQISWSQRSTNPSADASKTGNSDTMLKFDGIPYIMVAYNLLQCQYGVNKSLADKERRKAKRMEKGIDVTDHEVKFPSKKCGCPAQINVKYIVKFPDYQIDKDTSWKRRDTATQLRNQLRDAWDSVSMEPRFVGRLPDLNEHRYHELLEKATSTREFVLPELVVKAQELWLAGKSKKEILALLHSHVVDEMFWNKDPPDPKMKKYFPSLKSIHNYVNRVRYMCKFREEEKKIVKEIINEVLAREPATNVSFDISETMMGTNDTTGISPANKADTDEGRKENEMKKSVPSDKKVGAERGQESNDKLLQISEEEKDSDKNPSGDDVIIIGDDKAEEQREEGKSKLDKGPEAGQVAVDSESKSQGINVETFLFCYQTPQQQRLLKKYSNATYLVNVELEKPTKHVLTYAVYLLLVQTNVDYQVVGTILMSKHRKEGLQEALNIFREWNVFWTPKYFLVDYCEQSYNFVVNAIAAVFPESVYFINTQSCEKQWMSFILQPWNNLESHMDELVKFLKNMQFSLTEESLSIAALLFEQSQIWQNSDKFRTWFQSKWLPIAKYWVLGYRPEDLLLLRHSKSTIEDTFAPFQEALHLSARYNGFIDLLKSLVNSIPQDGYNRYVKVTNEAHEFYTHFRSNLRQGELLQGFPPTLLPYVGNICTLAEQHEFNIRQDQVGVFNVEYVVPPEQAVDNALLKKVLGQTIGSCPPPKSVLVQETQYGRIECSSQLDPGEFTVSFGDTTSYPFCTCTHWMLYRLPCVHMFAVFINVPGWRYDMLSPLYRFSDVMHLDFSCVTQPVVLKNIEMGTQSDSFKETIGTQTTGPDKPANIFETATNWSTSHLVLKEAKEFLSHIRKNSFLFRNKILYSQMCLQLDKLISKFSVSSRFRNPVTTSSDTLSPTTETSTVYPQNVSSNFHCKQKKKNSSPTLRNTATVDTRKPLKICSLNMQQMAGTTKDTAMGSLKVNSSSSVVPPTTSAPDKSNSSSTLDKIASKCQVPNAIVTLKHNKTNTINSDSHKNTSNSTTDVAGTFSTTISCKNNSSLNNSDIHSSNINQKHLNDMSNIKNSNISNILYCDEPSKSNRSRTHSSLALPLIDGLVTMDTDIMEDSDSSWPSLSSLPTTSCEDSDSACIDLITTCTISTQSTVHTSPTKKTSNQLTLSCTAEERPSLPCPTTTVPTAKKSDLDITRAITANITKVYPRRSNMSPISSQKRPNRKRGNSENNEEGSRKKPKISPIVRVTPATKAKIQKLVAAAANVTKGKYTLRGARDGIMTDK